MFSARARARPWVVLPATGKVRVRHKVLLAAEIVSAYIPLVRMVRTNDVEAMVRAARKRDRPPGSVVPSDARVTAIRLGRMVERLTKWLPDDRCLIRSLVVLRLLGQRGITARLVIGVRAERGFGAHAWVEHDGLPVLPATGYNRLLEL